MASSSSQVAASPKVFTGNFSSMIKACRGALRYTVHEPNCSCPKMKSIRSTLIENAKDETCGASSPNDSTSHSVLDGLMVVPDVKKKIPAVYTCLGTSKQEFDIDPLGAELKLVAKLFPSDAGNLPRIKVRCAMCLLQYQASGFVCVSSPSRSVVNSARDMARKQKQDDLEQGWALHADHAHHVCTVPRKALSELSQRTTHSEKVRATRDLALQLATMNNVPIDVDNRGSNKKLPDFQFGHHLTQLLHMTRNDVDADTTHWLVLVYDDSTHWTLDLPGGKRNLGEASVACAIRETREESSLVMDESWFLPEQPFVPKADKKTKKQNVKINAYYMARPPTELIMESLTFSDFFNNPGFCKEPSSSEKPA